METTILQGFYRGYLLGGAKLALLESQGARSSSLGTFLEGAIDAASQRVHMGIWYILRAQMGSHIPTLRPKYIPYTYMDPLGWQPLLRRSSALSARLAAGGSRLTKSQVCAVYSEACACLELFEGSSRCLAVRSTARRMSSTSKSTESLDALKPVARRILRRASHRLAVRLKCPF